MPYRDCNDNDREKSMEWTKRKWQYMFPDCEVIIESDDGKNPFSKTTAVNNCYKKSSGEILAMIDSDIYVDRQTILNSANIIKNGKVPWVRPCSKVYRLTKNKSEDIYNLNSNQKFPLIKSSDCERITPVVGLIAMF
jgi:hypothetical protein